MGDIGKAEENTAVRLTRSRPAPHLRRERLEPSGGNRPQLWTHSLGNDDGVIALPLRIASIELKQSTAPRRTEIGTSLINTPTGVDYSRQ